MNLDSIPAGSVVLLDANILISARRGASDQCRRLLARCLTEEIHGCLSAIAVAEFCHRRMMQEAQSVGLVGSNPAKVLSQNVALLGKLSQYRREVEDLIAGDLPVLSLDAANLSMALQLQRQFLLLTNDSLHLAAALRANIRILATNDSCFDLVPNLTVYKPDDIS